MVVLKSISCGTGETPGPTPGRGIADLVVTFDCQRLFIRDSFSQLESSVDISSLDIADSDCFSERE